jgi:hypothetical protein
MRGSQSTEHRDLNAKGSKFKCQINSVSSRRSQPACSCPGRGWPAAVATGVVTVVTAVVTMEVTAGVTTGVTVEVITEATVEATPTMPAVITASGAAAAAADATGTGAGGRMAWAHAGV